MSGRPIARLNATDVNVFFDQNSTTKADGAVYGNVRDTDQVNGLRFTVCAFFNVFMCVGML